MRAVFGLVLIVGMGLAGFAVYMVKGYMGNQEALLAQTRAKAATIVPTQDVYAVNRAIEYGEPLTVEDVVVIKYAIDYLPEGVFATKEELFPQGDDVVRVVTRPMEPNEPILAIKVTAPGQDAGITSRLSPGLRAFTIDVDASSGVSGFLRPGDRVDVYWTGSTPGSQGREGREITRLIQDSVELIAVDQTSDSNRNGAEVARTVTVQVSPQDVASLAQAKQTGRLSLSLVGLNDQTVASVTEVDQSSLLGIEALPEVIENGPPPEAEICYSRVRKGAELIVTEQPCPN